jgi:hypothetical protein
MTKNSRETKPQKREDLKLERPDYTLSVKEEQKSPTEIWMRLTFKPKRNPQ